MSIAEQKALYEERTGTVTRNEDVDRALARLAEGKSKFRQLSIIQRIALLEACLDDTVAVARDWVEVACQAKGLAPGNPQRAEEVSAGPMSMLRYLRLLINSMWDIENFGVPQLPGEIVQGPDGQVLVQVMPAKGLFDGLLFSGFKAHVWMQPEVTRANLRDGMATYYQHGCRDEGICVVLGAGNVSSIPPTDAFTKLFHEGKVCLLKMNPVNEYLGPIFERAFKSLIDAGYLKIVYGGGEVGAYAISHDLVDEVHITGSALSHETIVWGPPGEERQRRKAENDPVLKKAITSELGNVTPWIVVPGEYTDKQLRFQAENLAASIANNASFNCIATKMIITHKAWPQREKFLDMIAGVLKDVPLRKAYYPGAEERFEKFAGCKPEGCPAGTLPWTLRRDIDPEEAPHMFEEESFVCVCGEMAIEAPSAEDFLNAAVDFANHRMWGTLGVGILVHPSFRKKPGNGELFERAVADLRFGTIGINHWPALSYAMMSPPWGGFPVGNLHDPQSGIDWVHNTYMLEKAEKTVMEGPLVIFPKPFWFPSHLGAEKLGWKVFQLYRKPSLWKLPSVFATALRA